MPQDASEFCDRLAASSSSLEGNQYVLQSMRCDRLLAVKQVLHVSSLQKLVLKLGSELKPREEHKSIKTVLANSLFSLSKNRLNHFWCSASFAHTLINKEKRIHHQMV